MPQSVRSQPRTPIDTLLGGSDRIQPGSAQEAMVSRLNQQQTRRNRLRQNRPQQTRPRQRPLPRDSQERDMSEGLRQSAREQVGAPLPALAGRSPNQPNRNAPGTETGEQKENENEAENAEPEENRAGELRRQKQEERQKKAKEAGEKGEGTEATDLAAGAKKITTSLLRFSWLNLIETFGLLLIYINAHVILRLIFGDKFFCKLGEEWLPQELTPFGERTGGESMINSIGIIERNVLLVLDGIVATISIGVAALVVMILTWMTQFNEAGVLTKGWMIIKGIYDLGWSGVKSLVDLFGGL